MRIVYKYSHKICVEIYVKIRVITIKSPKEITIMAEGGKILAQIMQELKNKIKPGIATKELDRIAENLISKYKVESAFKGYKAYGDPKPFPCALCVSINEVIVHGVPSDYKLKQGDLLSLDLGIKHKGFFTDMAITVLVGDVAEVGGVQDSANFYEGLRLIRVAKKALKLAIKKIRPDNTIGDIGNVIQRYVEGQGFNVVRDFVGHGIGRERHEEPEIPNFGKRRKGQILKKGMVLCIEIMITAGDWKVKKSADGFGSETVDRSLSALFEHTVAVLENGNQILTSLK